MQAQCNDVINLLIKFGILCDLKTVLHCMLVYWPCHCVESHFMPVAENISS
ncbi:hypothetical protein [Sodalis-like endosymbiont of Proechinophthirus fluctus]|uniref:hypothetical protein n=1 Tax=Sodalis-like endosymbiont of Proechinophthirus fluctus TaxID=1462730 RepID=UPI000A49184F